MTQEKDDREKTELDKAREEEQLAREEFLEVQTQRREAFMAAYNHIKDGINSIYKDLTKSRVGPCRCSLTIATVGHRDGRCPWGEVTVFPENGAVLAAVLGITSANTAAFVTYLLSFGMYSASRI